MSVKERAVYLCGILFGIAMLVAIVLGTIDRHQSLTYLECSPLRVAHDHGAACRSLSSLAYFDGWIYWGGAFLQMLVVALTTTLAVMGIVYVVLGKLLGISGGAWNPNINYSLRQNFMDTTVILAVIDGTLILAAALGTTVAAFVQ